MLVRIASKRLFGKVFMSVYLHVSVIRHQCVHQKQEYEDSFLSLCRFDSVNSV